MSCASLCQSTHIMKNLAQNWPLVFSKIFQEKQMKGSNFFEKNQLFSVAIFSHSLTKSRGKSKA